MEWGIVDIFHRKVTKGFNIKAVKIIDSAVDARGGSLSFRIDFLKKVALYW